MCHVIATQQLLIYGLSGFPTHVDENWVNQYKKGSIPETEPTSEEVNELLELLITSVKQAEADYNSGLFKEFSEYTTSNKVTLSSIEDAISFNAFHEGLHLGVILSQLKSLKVSLF